MPKTKQLVVALGTCMLLILTALTQISSETQISNTAAVVLFNDEVPPIVVVEAPERNEESVRERLLAQLQAGGGDVIETPKSKFPPTVTIGEASEGNSVEVKSADSCVTGQDYNGGCVSVAQTGAIESTWLGFAADGKIVFSQHEGGQLVSVGSLDGCGGHEHPILWEGQVVTLYHYHALDGQLTSVGCLPNPPVVEMPQLILTENSTTTTE